MQHYLATLKNEATQLAKDISEVYIALLRIMIPALVIIKILDMLGATQWLAWLLAPLMSWVGLPESMGLVWASAILTNIYTSLAVFFTLADSASLSIAQVTILGTMILIAHAIPMEGAVAKAAGMRWRHTIALRVVGALVLGWILNLIYSSSDSLQAKATPVWRPEPLDPGLPAWIYAQLELLLVVLVVISSLMLALRLLRAVGIERLMHYCLSPLLKLLGISKQAANITVIGVTLGISFGGGLLIKEARSGHIAKRDIILSLCFLGLCHSLIEDTLLILLLGADLSGILWARFIFAVIVVAILARLPWLGSMNRQDSKLSTS